MQFQADQHALTRAIYLLEKKVNEKTEMIGRLRRTLALTDVKTTKSSKNVQTLEVCSVEFTSNIIQFRTLLFDMQG
jgi:hypothetical protein